MTPAGFPHSDIPGSKPVCGSPRLIAAYHVLRRLLVPRHPPCALSSLTGILTKVLPLCLPSVSYSIVKELAQRASAASGRPRACRQRSLSAPPCHFPTEPSLVSGGDSGARTRSLRLAKPALSQLSYIPAANRRGRPPRGPGALVGLGGLEPPTSRLSGVRSNQLSYRPTPQQRRGGD